MAVKRELSRTEGEADLESLVAAYERNLDHLRSPTYNEQELRLNFIDPFWRCLGWPVGEQGHLPPERVDVRIEIDSQGKRPDYQFQPDGVVRFFCEAKRPSEKLAKPSYAFQAKSYAWSFNRKSRSAPFVVLTNFDHFRFFKADVMPALERPDEGLISDFDLRYEDYIDRFDLLWNTFSRDQVVSGSLDQFIDYDALHLKALDREFLRNLLAWRKSLAETILGANRGLKRHELNEAVQRILDRIVFIRMIADKGAEPITLLSAVAKAADPFRALVTLSRRLEPDYNGLIFKPHFSDELRVDGKRIAAIIQALDPEHSPYRFDAVSIELLGRIYEAFLGHQIEINSDGKTCRVEAKPELLKSGGVYYTPEFVVDYIVRKALDPLV